MPFNPDELDTNVLQQMYGFASNQINAVPELRAIYDQAVAEGWFESNLGLQRFQKAIQNSNWYRENNIIVTGKQDRKSTRLNSSH